MKQNEQLVNIKKMRFFFYKPTYIILQIKEKGKFKKKKFVNFDTKLIQIPELTFFSGLPPLEELELD